MDTKKTLADNLEETLAAIQRLREEIRVKIHLARMDAKDAWSSLEPDIEAIEKDIRAALARDRNPGPGKITLDEAKLQLHLALMDAKESWEKIEPKLLPILDHLGKALSLTEEEGIERRVQTAERRARVRAELQKAGAALENVARAIVDEVQTGVTALRDRFVARPPAPTPPAQKPTPKPKAKARAKGHAKAAKPRPRHA